MNLTIAEQSYLTGLLNDAMISAKKRFAKGYDSNRARTRVLGEIELIANLQAKFNTETT